MDGPWPARAPDAVIIAIRDRERKRKGVIEAPAASSNLAIQCWTILIGSRRGRS
jgi:hypothetical protein